MNPFVWTHEKPDRILVEPGSGVGSQRSVKVWICPSH